MEYEVDGVNPRSRPQIAWKEVADIDSLCLHLEKVVED